jgi:aminopeptidase N
MTREIISKTFTPTFYNLTFTPNFTDFTFDGYEEISIKMNEQTDEIVLNINDIKIKTCFGLFGSNVPIYPVLSYDEDKDRVIMKFEDIIVDSQFKLIIMFKGNLNDQMAGFYRSKYFVDGEQRWSAVTQFESTDARRAFPCVDEPARKSIFQITLKIPKTLLGLSNTDPISTRYDDDYKVITFKKTPIMSTYLVAFYVGESDYIERDIKNYWSKNKLTVRVFTPLGKKEKGEFALDLACKVLNFYEQYFGIDYPLSKMDMIAIPDFSAGAMENWGLITYRERLILCDDDVSIRSKVSIAYVICHELAHQWFGNLVTMEWWSQLWLNEGFATWVGWMATDKIFPEWKSWEIFINEEFEKALDLDALDNSHPIEVEIEKASQVDEIFDAISYSKGANIIRMLVNHLSPEIFQTGIKYYLQKYKYSNASTDDLWDCLSKSSNKDIKLMMNSWTKQKGYPILKVNTEKNSYKLEQEIFRESYKSNPTMINTIWKIPLGIKSDSNINSLDKIMETKNMQLIPLNKKMYMKFNTNSPSLFRVCYDKHSLLNITKNIDKLTNVDRNQILSDSYSFAISGYDNTNTFLELLKAYNDESDYHVINGMCGSINDLKNVWSNDKVDEFLNKIEYPIVHRIHKDIGWDYDESDSYQTSLLRSLVIKQLTCLKHKDTIDKLVNMTSNFLDNNVPINPNLKSFAFKSFIRDNRLNFNKLLKYYKSIDSSEEKIRILTALGCCFVEDLDELLDLTFANNIIRAQDSHFVVKSLCERKEMRFNVWSYLEKNWDKFTKQYKGNMLLFGRIINCILSSMYDRDKLQICINFLNSKSKDTETIMKSIAQSIEKVKNRLNWIDRDKEQVLNKCEYKGLIPPH